jgi:hypothetical protein
MCQLQSLILAALPKASSYALHLTAAKALKVVRPPDDGAAVVVVERLDGKRLLLNQKTSLWC